MLEILQFDDIHFCYYKVFLASTEMIFDHGSKCYGELFKTLNLFKKA